MLVFRFVRAADGVELGSTQSRGPVVVSPDGSALASTSEPLMQQVVVRAMDDPAPSDLEIEGLVLTWLAGPPE